MRIEEYDFQLEQRRLRSMQRDMERMERQHLATARALDEHPVTAYVKNLPVQPTTYPAIRYLRLADRLGRDVEEVYDHFRRVHDREVRGSSVQDIGSSLDHDDERSLYHGIRKTSYPGLGSIGDDDVDDDILSVIGYDGPTSTFGPTDPLYEGPSVSGDLRLPPIRDGHRSSASGYDRPDGRDDRNLDGPVDPDGSDDPDDLYDPVYDGVVDPYQPEEFIHWSMPGHDLDRPRRKGCGFIRASDNTMVYSACPEDHEHHIKAKRRHCWSLHCPQCMNDTALKRGIAIETQLLEYRMLLEKDGGHAGEIGHWVISPPQSLAKCLCQTRGDFDNLCKYVDNSMIANGATAGATVFHPWRQQEGGWRFSPHFHILCYGFIDTKAFLKANPGWIIKKVHSRERIRSIRHTAAYLVTHMGLGYSEKDAEDIDWDLIIIDRLIPGILSPKAKYSEKDHDDKSMNKGRMVGDISDIDWEDWVMRRLSGEFKLRYWGGASKVNIRTIDIYRQYKIRLCKECGTPLRVYDGFSDHQGTYVRYIQDNQIVVFKDQLETAKEIFQRFRSRPKGIDEFTICDLARESSFAVCTLELPVPQNDDLVMSGPFAEPDSYFLNRQRAAFGTDTEVCA